MRLNKILCSACQKEIATHRDTKKIQGRYIFYCGKCVKSGLEFGWLEEDEVEKI